MNTLHCLALCVAFAACISNKPKSKVANKHIYYNSTLRGDLLIQHENFRQALHHIYKVLEGIATSIDTDLKSLGERVSYEQRDCTEPSNYMIAMHFTSSEYQKYCDFCREKIQWIKEALQQDSYTIVAILRNILLLAMNISSFAGASKNWHSEVAERPKIFSPEVRNLFGGIVYRVEKLEQAQWAVAFACMFNYEEYDKLSKYGAEDDARAVAFIDHICTSEATRRRIIDNRNFITRYDALCKHFLGEFKKNVEVPDEEFQKDLEKNSAGTPLVFSSLSDEERKKILNTISTGTVAGYRGAPEEISAEELVGAAEEAKDQETKSDVTEHPAGKRPRKETKRSKQKNKKKGRPAADQKPDGTDTKEMQAKVVKVQDQVAKSVVMEHQLSKEIKKQMPEQQTKTKGQEKKDAKKEEKEMVDHAGGIGDNYERKLDEFIVLHDRFDSKPNEMSYKEVDELLTSPIWWKLGVITGKIMSMHVPHGNADPKDPMCKAILGLCKKKWESLKRNEKYTDVLVAIKERKEQVEKSQQEK